MLANPGNYRYRNGCERCLRLPGTGAYASCLLTGNKALTVKAGNRTRDTSPLSLIMSLAVTLRACSTHGPHSYSHS